MSKSRPDAVDIFAPLVEQLRDIAPPGTDVVGELTSAIKRELARTPEELDAIRAKLDAKRAERGGK